MRYDPRDYETSLDFLRAQNEGLDIKSKTKQENLEKDLRSRSSLYMTIIAATTIAAASAAYYIHQNNISLESLFNQ
jgi:hypothetical protein